MEEWITTQTLLSCDFEMIRSEIVKFNYSYSTTQKLASYYLSKNLKCPDRAQWTTEAATLLVYCATLIPCTDTLSEIPFDLRTWSAVDWMARLGTFTNTTRKKQVTRDCIYELHKAGYVTFKDLIQEPNLLAALAHRITVHELMAPRIEGKSVVTHVLRNQKIGARHLKAVRHNFLESLYGAYKADFQHIISLDLSELVAIVELKLNKCLNFLRRTKIRFPCVDFAFGYLHPSVIEAVKLYNVEPVKLGDFNDIYKGLYHESQYELRLKSPADVIEHMMPYLKLIYEHKMSKRSKMRVDFDNDANFPLLELPTEIIEMILLYLDMNTMLALKSVSSMFKAFSVDAKRLMKFQFPRKHHQFNSRADNASVQWDSIYWRDSSILTRWNKGKYWQYPLSGDVHTIDDNIAILSHRSLTGYLFDYQRSFYYVDWREETNDKHYLTKTDLQSDSRFSTVTKAAVIDSTGSEPVLALLSQNQAELFIGTKFISKHQLFEHSLKYVHSCNYKLYVDQYMFTLDDRFTRQKVLNTDSEVLDVNPMTDMFLSKNHYTSTDFGVKLHAPGQADEIGQLFDEKMYWAYAKFLDEYRVAGVSSNEDVVDVVDIRKMNGIVSRISGTGIRPSHWVLDAVNQRVLSVTSRIANIWELNTYKWSGGFYIGSVPGGICSYTNFFGPAKVSTRHFTYKMEESTALMFDFKRTPLTTEQ